MLRVAVSGACGKMGQVVVGAVLAQNDMVLVGVVDPAGAGRVIRADERNDIEISSSLGAVLSEAKPDVLIDFTRPSVAGDNALLAIRHGTSPVVGTTGIGNDKTAEIERLAVAKGVGAAIVPNFSVGMVALTKAAKVAAGIMAKAEIVEMHHDAKLDAPSGTALRLRGELKGVLGYDVPIHSVRLPGLVAHHEVLLGAPGQVLTIRHDTLDRQAFVPGILLVTRKIRAVKGLIVGLEPFLES